MKPFWDGFFFDLEECNLTKEQVAKKVGNYIGDELDRIFWHIKTYEPLKAMEMIKELKKII